MESDRLGSFFNNYFCLSLLLSLSLSLSMQSYGPHPFFMHLRDGEEGNLLPGIRIDDMVRQDDSQASLSLSLHNDH